MINLCSHERGTAPVHVNRTAPLCSLTRAYKKFFLEKNATLPLALCLWGFARWHYGGISGIFGRFFPFWRICNSTELSIRICNPINFLALQMLTLIVVGLQIRPNGEGSSCAIKIPDKFAAIIRRKVARDLNVPAPFKASDEQKMGFRSANNRELNFK